MQEILNQHNISQEVRKAIKEMGFTALTDVQARTLPHLMDGKDCIALAPTGTGKTLAFSIPMLEYVNLESKDVQELVLCPTRELAMQIAEEMTALGKYIKGLKIAVICGGMPIKKQIQRLGQSPQIIIGTPGRVRDLIGRKALDLRAVHTLVLDEADEMLNMGFVKDVSSIIECTSKDRQLILFSATSNVEVMNIAWKYLYNPVEITVEATLDNKPKITEYILDCEDKFESLLYLLDSSRFDRMIVFTNTKVMCEKLRLMIEKQGYACDCLHGDMPQSKRSVVMDKYKKGKFPLLIATDIAARGIDVDDVEAVINYDLPNENEYYLHRIGRTGRAKKYGVAFSLINFREKFRMQDILRYISAEPIALHFNSYGVLVNKENQAFFETI